MPLSPVAGASASFRGYRHQCLYTLHRALTLSIDEVVQPEGIEDLAVFDGAHLAEVCQVKSVGEPLAVHHLKAARGSFFTRAAAVLREDPNCDLRIVSFGPVGPELAAAIASDGPERSRVISKLSADSSVSPEELRAVFERLHPIDEVTEPALEGSIESRLAQLVTGIDAKASLDLLMFWVYRFAEARSALTRARVEKQLVDVGRYLSERTAHHLEWFTTIEPLEDLTIDATRRDALAAEIHHGMQARWEHIQAGVTVPRPAQLGRIEDALRDKRVAVVHGASGQGKSTLAYQFMRDLPEVWRFRVRRIDDREHAARIAMLLASFGRTLELPAYVLVDVGASDTSWPELVARMYEEENLRILVAIREEDWRRSEPSRATFDLADVPLYELQRPEAEDIFRGLDATARSREILDFEQAWTTFGGEGPLLEFVHVATQGSTLRDVLREQLGRILDEARRGTRPSQEIDLLRHVAVASAYGARLRLGDLVEALSVPAPVRAVDLLEREYLVRVEEGGAAITGLHPVRSGIIADLLTDPVLDPWLTTARSCLPLLYEEDLEIFLLHAFSRRPDLRDDLRTEAVGLRPKSWRGLAGVGRALLWLGIVTYDDANRSLIDRLHATYGESYSLYLDWDIAGVMPGMADEVIETIAGMSAHGDEMRAAVAAARAEQRPTDEVWQSLRDWLLTCQPPNLDPTSGEWSDVGQFLFWSGHLQVDRSFDNWLSVDGVARVWDEAPLGAIADLMVGCHSIGSRHLPQLQAARDATDRVFGELLIARIENDQSRVVGHFIVPIAGSSVAQGGEELDLHTLTMERVGLLRRLYPECDVWGAQGYGHRILDLGHDATTKAIPRRDLPVRWLTSVNGQLLSFDQLHRRPADWDRFRDELATRRRAAVRALRILADALRSFHRSSSDHVIGFSLDPEAVEDLRRTIDAPLRLPRSAVDEWGFVAEASSTQASRSVVGGAGQPLRLSLRRFKPLLDAKRDWSVSVTNALQQVPRCLAVDPILARRPLSDDQRMELRAQAERLGVGVDLGPLTSLNVRDAYWRLGPLQAASAALFAGHAHASEDRDLAVEAGRYLSFGAIWECFLARPGLRVADAQTEADQRLSRRIRQLRRDLERLAVPEGPTSCRVLSTSHHWNHAPALFLAFDTSEDSTSQYAAAERLLGSVRDLLRGDSALAGRLTALAFRSVVVVLLVRGKAITADTLVFNTLDMQSERELTPLDFIPKQLTTETMTALGVEPISHPMLSEANALLEAVARHWSISAHLADVLSLGEADDRAEERIRSYVDDVASRLSATIDDEMLRMRRLDEWASGLDGTLVGDLAAALGELWSQVVPDARETMVSVQQLADARTRLEGARDLALLIRSEVAGVAAQPS